jgi:hypothetical protein
MFSIIHSNVDGAGTQATGIATLAAAKAEADRLQAAADAHGNPYLYSYVVYGPGEWLAYRTKPTYNAALAAAHYGA